MSKVREIRISKYMSQEELAYVAGVSVRTINRIENGGKPTSRILKMIAQALSVPVKKLEGE